MWQQNLTSVMVKVSLDILQGTWIHLLQFSSNFNYCVHYHGHPCLFVVGCALELRLNCSLFIKVGFICVIWEILVRIWNCMSYISYVVQTC